MVQIDGTQEFIPADLRLRKLIVAAWIVSVAAGAATILWVLPWAQKCIGGQEPEKALRIIQAMLVAIFLSLVPFALYLLWFGRQVVVSGQIPPPGTRVIVHTRIVVGSHVRMRGRAIMAMAALLLALGLLGSTWLPYRIGQVFAASRHQTPDST